MFDEVLGNDRVKKELIKTIEQNKLSHSYLFIGTEGIGKKIIAKEFAKRILNLNEEFNIENSVDLEIVEPEGLSIKIDQIRQMQKKIIEAPIKSGKKVYIVDNADLMTTEAQNCLLKTLEEPPEFVVIILIGCNESDFLSTIKSRCMIIKFQDISNEEIKKYLKEKYNMNVTEEMLQVFGGSIGKAERYKSKEDLYNTIFEIVENIKKLDFIEFLKSAEKIYEFQNDKFEILENINVCLYNKAKDDIKYLNCIDIIEDAKKRLLANGNFNMCIDNMLFRLWEELH